MKWIADRVALIVWLIGFGFTLCSAALALARYIANEDEQPYLILALLAIGLAGMHLARLLDQPLGKP